MESNVVLIFILIGLLACTAGSLCGIGGGIIIKPVLDLSGLMPVESASFLSGCTVLAMTAFSVGRTFLEGNRAIDVVRGTPLAAGAGIGGVAGQFLFSQIAGTASDTDALGMVQTGILFFVTLGTLVYTLFEHKVTTLSIESKSACGLVGLGLGMLSSFLGIGGGPINLLVLHYFFSMERKKAALNSLYIILFSQLCGLAVVLLNGSPVGGALPYLPAMAGAGIAGGLIQEGLTLKFAGVTVYFSVPLVVLITILMGALVGALNGVVITKFNVAPFIATLGSMYICRGLANIRSNGATFSELAGHEGLGNTGFEIFGRNFMGTMIPVGVIILAIVAVIAGLILKKTPFGWHVQAIGGNEKASKLSGIKVDRVKIWVYAFSGLCSAIVGIIATSQLVSATPKTGESWEMNAIAASVLGGTSMAGGVGSIGGTIVGAFVIGVINDGMTMCGVTEFWQKIIRGLVIIVAVIIDQFQRNLQAKMALQARNENK